MSPGIDVDIERWRRRVLDESPNDVQQSEEGKFDWESLVGEQHQGRGNSL
jgi:hypothetical protein